MVVKDRIQDNETEHTSHYYFSFLFNCLSFQNYFRLGQVSQNKLFGFTKVFTSWMLCFHCFDAVGCAAGKVRYWRGYMSTVRCKWLSLIHI